MPSLKATQNSPALKAPGRHAPVEPHRIGRKREGEEKARTETGSKQVRHRRLGDKSIDDHRDRRRDDDAERAARHDGAERELVVVSGLTHGRVHHGTDRQHGDDRRAGDGGEHRTGQNRGDGEPSRQWFRQRGENADQSLRNRAARHDAAAQDEERDRQDHLLVEADPHVLDNVLEIAAAPEHVHAGGSGKQNDKQRLSQGE